MRNSATEPDGDTEYGDHRGAESSFAIGKDNAAATLRAYKAAFAQALERQDDDFVRIADERHAEGRRIAAALDACETWNELASLQQEWAGATSEACLIEARWLVLYADMIRHPEWLSRQARRHQRDR